MITKTLKYYNKNLTIIYFSFIFLCLFHILSTAVNSKEVLQICRNDKELYKGPWETHPNFHLITQINDNLRNSLIYEGNKLTFQSKSDNKLKSIEICKNECLSENDYKKEFPLNKINRFLMIWLSNNQYSYEFMGKDKQFITINCGAPDHEYSVTWTLYKNGKKIIREEVLNGKNVFIQTNDFNIDNNKPWILNQDSIPTQFRKNNFINNIFY